ncbi:MAG: hypothetical protein M1829_005804 [Trizodia sp. TS-e1964]|nr:MAG: hypothetical protein M1829_005804 [Trizodia sp. TS-e1964]
MASEELSSKYLLLLLPQLSSLTASAVEKSYGPVLSALLSGISKSSNGAIVLDVAFSFVATGQRYDFPPNQVFVKTQRVLASVYRFISVVCTDLSIGVGLEGDVDIRVLLLAYQNGHKHLDPNPDPNESHSLEGPVVDLATLAASKRSWECIYSVDSEDGNILLTNFLSLVGPPPSWKVQKVRLGDVASCPDEPLDEASGIQSIEKRYFNVAVGGTFDHLHVGHKLLLTMTAFLLQNGSVHKVGQIPKLVIGITGDELLKKKDYREFLQSWDQRQQKVIDFLLAVLDFSPPGKQNISRLSKSIPGSTARAIDTIMPSGMIIECVEIFDAFGPTITDESVSALVVSAETRMGGRAVNSQRRDQGWQELDVFEVNVLDGDGEGSQNDSQDNPANSFASKISSTAIRRLQKQRVDSTASS